MENKKICENKDKEELKTQESNKSSEESAKEVVISQTLSESIEKIPKSDSNSNTNPLISMILDKTENNSMIDHKDCEISAEDMQKLKQKGLTNLKQISRGSYGMVYKANSNANEIRVAIKVIDLKRLSQIFFDQFLSVEIELMRKLSEHQNVAKFYEIIEGINNHFVYLVLEFCQNGDLYDYILERHFVPEREACVWFKQLISGVEHIHRNGFAHRDLKCENLLLSDQYVIKIIDFGFSCRLEYPTDGTEEKIQNKNNSEEEEYRSETFCGSFEYAAPELLTGLPYLPTKADIWSCGAILYVMLFGTFPNDSYQLKQFIKNSDHFIDVPEQLQVSNECKQLLNNILIKEHKRYSINKIKESDWFQKEWHTNEPNVDNKEYFKNLNLPRVMTEKFIVSHETQSATDSLNLYN